MCSMPVPATASGRRASLSRSFLVAAATSLLAVAATVSCGPPARGAVVVDAAGVSAAGHPVAFRATLAILGDVLTIDLENVSPVATTDPADVLTSFAFDMTRSGARPALALRQAAGQVYRVRNNKPDEPLIYTPPATAGGTGTFTSGFGPSDLVATKAGDLTWQFRRLDPTFDPLAGFSLGTVANLGLDPNSYTEPVVGPIDFGIYAGADAPIRPGLNAAPLVREHARFTLTGVACWKEADIGDRFTFGLGTKPDSLIVVTVSEPSGGGACMLLIAELGVVAWLAGTRRRHRHRGPGSP